MRQRMRPATLELVEQIIVENEPAHWSPVAAPRSIIAGSPSIIVGQCSSEARFDQGVGGGDPGIMNADGGGVLCWRHCPQHQIVDPVRLPNGPVVVEHHVRCRRRLSDLSNLARRIGDKTANLGRGRVHEHDPDVGEQQLAPVHVNALALRHG